MNDSKSTVANLIKLKAFNNKATLINQNCNTSRIVSHVTIMESPDLYKWVTGGEFVLTTWYSLRTDPALAEASFRKLAPKIAAIGIKTHRFIDDIPDVIIKIAEEFKLPVFEIKRDTFFRELVNIIANQIQNYQLNMFVEAEDFYKCMIDASSRSSDVEKILQVLAQRIHQSCAFMNSELRIICQKGKVVGAENLREIQRHLYTNILQSNLVTEYGTVSKVAFFPCYFQQKSVGFILVPDNILENDRYKLFCQQATLFLSGRLWTLYDDAQRKKLKFIEYLNNSNEVTIDFIKFQLNSFGVTTDGSLSVAIIYAEHDLESIYYYFDGVLSNKIIVMDQNKIILILAGNKDFASYEIALRYFNKLKDSNYLVISSNPIQDILLWRNDYLLANESLNLFKELHLWGFKKVGDYQLYMMLYLVKDKPIYKFVKENILNPIINFDNKYNSELLKTLYFYSLHDSVSNTAAALHIHVNTLRYRLDKIKEITGKEINNPMDKLEMLIVAKMAALENFQLTQDENYQHRYNQ